MSNVIEILQPDDRTLMEIAQRAKSENLALIQRDGRMALCPPGAVPDSWQRLKLSPQLPGGAE